MPAYVPLLALFCVSAVVTLLVTPLARGLAWRVGAVDRPGPRRVNRTPVARMGGVAIFCGIVAALLTQLVGTAFFGWPAVLVPSPHLQLDYPLVFLAFVAIFAVGVVDDICTLRPLHKLVGQVVAASIAVAGGLVIGVIVNPLDPGTVVSLGWAAYPITVVYLVAYVNIINLIDGLDGLAAGISAIASLTMLVLSLWAGRLDAAALSVAVCGSCLGFLRYNFNPASVFMGDSGSLLLGFALGTISLLSVTRVAGLTTIIMPLVIAAVPITDTFSAIVRRTRAGVSVGTADRGHIHHRLLGAGFSQRQTVLIMYAWTGLMCVGALVMTQLTLWPRICVFVALVAASAAFTAHLRLFEPVLLHHRDPKTGDDELVGPGDAAFEGELEEFEEEHEGHLRRALEEHEGHAGRGRAHDEAGRGRDDAR